MSHLEVIRYINKEMLQKANNDALEAIKRHLMASIKMLGLYFGDKNVQLTLIRIIRVI
jgi:hypothetical protein